MTEGYSVNGHYIRHLRLQKRMTQQKLAQVAGLSVTQISRIEKGHHTARFSTVEAIAEALNQDPDDLFELTLMTA